MTSHSYDIMMKIVCKPDVVDQWFHVFRASALPLAQKNIFQNSAKRSFGRVLQLSFSWIRTSRSVRQLKSRQNSKSRIRTSNAASAGPRQCVKLRIVCWVVRECQLDFLLRFLLCVDQSKFRDRCLQVQFGRRKRGCAGSHPPSNAGSNACPSPGLREIQVG